MLLQVAPLTANIMRGDTHCERIQNTEVGQVVMVILLDGCDLVEGV